MTIKKHNLQRFFRSNGGTVEEMVMVMVTVTVTVTVTIHPQERKNRCIKLF